jgi:predicted RNA binding protein YcfA (HicA-like mRNA interferase family)
LRFPNQHEPTPACSQARSSSSGSAESRLFYRSRQRSHYYLKHPDKPGLRVTLPFHGTDLKRRTLTSIIDQAGFSVEEFLELL